MLVELERQYTLSAAECWRRLTDPVAMNAWSSARVELIHAGDGERPDSVGTTRRVYIRSLGLTLPLDERVRESERPRRFVYTVERGAGIRDHRGTITIREHDGRAHVRWRVEATLRLRLLDPLFAWILRRQLGASLDALAASPSERARSTTE